MNINNNPILETRISKVKSYNSFQKMVEIIDRYCRIIDYSNTSKTDDIIRILVEESECPGAYLDYRGTINHFLRYLRVRKIPIQSISKWEIYDFWNHKCDKMCLPAHRFKGTAKFLAISRLFLFLQYQGILPENGWDTTDVELCTNFRDVIEHLGVEAGRANMQARQALHFIVWLRLHGIGRAAINNQIVNDFLSHDCRCGLHMRSGRATGQARDRRRVAIQRFLRFLEGKNPIFLDDVFITDRKRVQLLPSALRYRAWLLDQKGLQPRTVYFYLVDLMRWLPKFGEDASGYNASNIRELAISEFHQLSPPMQSRFIKSVRSYLKFRAFEGHCNSSIAGALISRPSYRLSAVPRRLDVGMVGTVIQGCNLKTARGIRERAILILLAQLGLRAVEVWRLRLEDFDWSGAKLRIQGKGGRGAVVPITQDAGDAVLDYLQHARPQSESNVLFLRSRHPYTPLARAAEISNIVRFALARCGQKGGAHVFRHTLATELLRDGRSLEDVATVLRHRSVDTTMIYAKVNEPMLKRLAEPWMGDHL